MDGVLRWDCGPGCGTTGCGNTPDDLRRYANYRKSHPEGRSGPGGMGPGWGVLLVLLALALIIGIYALTH